MAEGLKTVSEFINSGYSVKTVYHTPYAAANLNKLPYNTDLEPITAAELEKMSSLTTPQEVLAVIRIPAPRTLNNTELQKKFTLVLDGVQDPGNLGTIIRTADWFGIQNIICSEDTVDAYNPKVVQATMGSLARTNIHYTDLAELLPNLDLPIFGALLDGENIYRTDFGNEGLILMGNEGNGIRPDIQALVDRAITIPRIGKAESLNVAIATALFCSEICGKKFNKNCRTIN